MHCSTMRFYDGPAGMAQWWERSPPKKLISVQCHLWAEFVVSFSRVLRFSFFHKNQRTKFQFHQNRGPTWKPAKAEVVSTLCYSFMIMIGVRLGRFIFLCMWSVWTNQFSLFLAELITWWRQQRERARVRENRAPIMSRACVPDMRGERVRYPTP